MKENNLGGNEGTGKIGKVVETREKMKKLGTRGKDRTRKMREINQS